MAQNNESYFTAFLIFPQRYLDCNVTKFCRYSRNLSILIVSQAKIEFAVKLGYSERLARTALQRLGADPPRNELLAELIKLAAKQPPRALSPPPPAEPDPPPDRASLRHIVIDGSNVAMRSIFKLLCKLLDSITRMSTFPIL